MTIISTDKAIVTSIHIYTVLPEKQQALVDLLIRAAAPMSKVTGFISANIHASLDGTKVANYTQWQTLEDFHAMQKDPTSQPHAEEEAALATSEAGSYSVVSIHPSPAAEPAPIGNV